MIDEGGYLSPAGCRVFVVLLLAAIVGVVIVGGNPSDARPPRQVEHTVPTLPWVPEAGPLLPNAEANDMGDPTFNPYASTTTSTPAPAPTVRPAARASWAVSSTVYCLRGTTASGRPVGPGIAAVSYSDWPRLRGTRWRVTAGPPEILGRTYLVADKGPAAHFDVWMGDRPDCPRWGRYTYGRRAATVVPA